MKYLILLLSFAFLSPDSTLAQCYDCDSDAFLGVYSNGISKTKARKLNFENTEGSYVTGVIRNTAAKEAGLQPFDYVYGVDDYRTNYDRSLTDILRKYEPGDKVIIHFYRNGKTEKRNTKLGMRSDAKYQKRSKREDPFLGVEQISNHSNSDIEGVKVNVVSNSTASSIGLEDKDIITHINGFPILDWTDMGSAIDMMVIGEKMEVTYLRDGRKGTVSGNVKSLAATKYNTNSYSYNSNDGKTNTYTTTKTTTKTTHYDSDEDDDIRNISGGLNRNVNDMEVEMEEMTQAESRRMSNDYDVDMPIVNNLSIKKLTIAPNSNMGMFELTFELPSKGNTAINIYNTDGRNIYNYDLGSFSGAFEDQIDIAQNGEGTYFLQVQQDNKSIVKKIILVRR